MFEILFESNNSWTYKFGTKYFLCYESLQHGEGVVIFQVMSRIFNYTAEIVQIKFMKTYELLIHFYYAAHID
jgi:hypothetical protein